MSHLDEGTLHALLDGELGSTELMEIEAHLAGCSACSTRLRTAREFLEEADRLVGSVQFGNYASPPGAASAPQRPVAKPEPAAPPVPPPPAPPREHHPWDDESPVLLIPDNPESSPLIRRWPKLVGWAAMIALAVSGGVLVSNIAKETPASIPTSPDAGSTIASSTDSEGASNATPTDRLSKTDRHDSDASVLADGKAPAQSLTEVATKQAPAKTPPAKPAPVKPTQPKPAAATAGTLAAKTARPEPKDEDTAVPTDSADASEEAATKSAEQESVRLQAAQALSQLDRERRLSRAAAATAALDQQAAARRAVTPAAPAPAPPTPEQRAQVYLRIGLDEANRQLGGPVHVIEGLNPMFMGLAPGRVAVGADTTRPVVRVVYQDAQGRMIVLDQQRSRPGQGALPAGAWTLGDVTVGLQGEVPPEILRSLRSRVR